MGVHVNGRYILLILAVQLAYLVQAVKAAGKCDEVFRDFSKCITKMGDQIEGFSQGVDEDKNLNTICSYWNDFHVCAVTALADCHEGAADMWEKLKKDSKKLNIEGSLFQMCGGSNGSARAVHTAILPFLMVSLTTLLTWIF